MLTLLSLVIISLVVWLGVQVLAKAGYSGWWALTLIIPFVNLIMLWIFAFGVWPIERKNV